LEFLKSKYQECYELPKDRAALVARAGRADAEANAEMARPPAVNQSEVVDEILVAAHRKNHKEAQSLYGKWTALGGNEGKEAAFIREQREKINMLRNWLKTEHQEEFPAFE
jgi:hypothetical protein